MTSPTPDLRTIPGVELVRVGRWEASTGEWSPTADDLAAAVEAHRAGILRKLDLHNQTDLVRYAIKRGIITLDS